MIHKQEQINIQFGDGTVGVGATHFQLVLSSLNAPANFPVKPEEIETLVDYSKPEVVLHFPTSESVKGIIELLQRIQVRLKQRELELALREALDAELAKGDLEVDGEDDEKHEGCGCGHEHEPDLHSEDEII